MPEQLLEGLVMSCRPLGENDRLLTLLSEAEGMVRLAVPGARRPRSSLAGLFDKPSPKLRRTVLPGKNEQIVEGRNLLPETPARQPLIQPVKKRSPPAPQRIRKQPSRHMSRNSLPPPPPERPGAIEPVPLRLRYLPG